VRPAADISTGFRAGPTACDARLAFGMLMSICVGPSGPTYHTRAVGSRRPNGLTPLNSGCARPFQKLRWLNTALITAGACLPVTCRTLTPLTLNTGSAAEVVDSAPVRPMPLKVALRMPCDPATLSLSVFASLVNG
jgi:hypothetical protein